jgi:hypothetical protein
MLDAVTVVLVIIFAMSGLVSMSLWVGIRFTYMEKMGLKIWQYFPRSHKDFYNTIIHGGKEGKIFVILGSISFLTGFILFFIGLIKMQ